MRGSSIFGKWLTPIMSNEKRRGFSRSISAFSILHSNVFSPGFSKIGLVRAASALREDAHAGRVQAKPIQMNSF